MTEQWISFAQPAAVATPPRPAWKLAIIDDDQAVHDGTRFALQSFSLNNQSIRVLSAYSAAEGLRLLRENPDIAVVLLDVVMETEDAGLRLARAIREELDNDIVRIILRTGQPGQAPEHKIVVDYDINDYKAKTELTAEKLFTALTAALRSFEQLKRLDDTRVGLELIVAASSELFDDRSIQKLAHGVLIQLNTLLQLKSAGILVLREGADAEHAVLARIGSFAGEGPTGVDFPSLFGKAASHEGPIFRDGHTHLYVRTGSGSEILVVLDTLDDLNETQVSLVTVFSAKLAVAFDNAKLHEWMRRTNAELEDRVRQRTVDLASANERLEAQSVVLKRVNTFKNEILGTVAHDLKNPLAVILGRAEMLSNMAGGLADGKGAAFETQVEHLRTAAKRMTRIVDVSVADAMADAMDIQINRRRVDLADVVRTAAELNGNLAEAKTQRMILDIDGPLPVSCDPDRLAEAIDNLVSNAVKYTPVGGTVALRAAATPTEVRVTVADSGPGLKPEDLVRLFGRFQRLSAQPTGGESSTGLGLSIVHKIVDLHGGHVDVAENGPYGGASFTVSLPRRSQA